MSLKIPDVPFNTAGMRHFRKKIDCPSLTEINFQELSQTIGQFFWTIHKRFHLTGIYSEAGRPFRIQLVAEEDLGKPEGYKLFISVDLYATTRHAPIHERQLVQEAALRGIDLDAPDTTDEQIEALWRLIEEVP